MTQVMWQSPLMDSAHLTLPLLMGSASHFFFFLNYFFFNLFFKILTVPAALGSLFPGQGLEPGSPPATKCQVPTPGLPGNSHKLLLLPEAWPGPWFWSGTIPDKCSFPIFLPAPQSPPWRQPKARTRERLH